MADKTLPPDQDDVDPRILRRRERRRQHRALHRDEINEKRRTPEERVKAAARMKAWRQKHLEEQHAYQNAWHAQNAERINAEKREKTAAARAARPPKPEKTLEEKRAEAAAYQRAYRERNREEVNTKRRQKRAENREEVNQKRREYRAQPGVWDRELAQARNRNQQPERKAAIAAATKVRREANLEEAREYERLQQAERRKDPITKARMDQLNKESYDRRRDKILNRLREQRIEDPETFRARDRNRDPVKRTSSNKAYRNRHPEIINARARAKHQRRKATDPLYKIRKILRDRHNAAIRGNVKVGSAIRDLGCSIKEIKIYIESFFQEGMSWENYGHDTWHLDHVTPLSSFNLMDPEQVKVAFHYTNLQPLWAPDNYQKGATLPGIDQAGFTPS